MLSLKEIFSRQYASIGRQRALDDFQQQYEPKKGGRFHLEGITYEVGLIEVNSDGLQFEVSSKIPLEQLPAKVSRENYFDAVKKLAEVKDKTPVYVGMDDIIHKVGDREIKKRDYIRLKYQYEYPELYDEQAVVAEAQAIQEGKLKLKVPDIPGVRTLCGRLVLLRLSENICQKIKHCMQALVDANEKVRKKFK